MAQSGAVRRGMGVGMPAPKLPEKPGIWRSGVARPSETETVQEDLNWPAAGFQIFSIAVIEYWMPKRQKSADTVEKLDNLNG